MKFFLSNTSLSEIKQEISKNVYIFIRHTIIILADYNILGRYSNIIYYTCIKIHKS